MPTLTLTLPLLTLTVPLSCGPWNLILVNNYNFVPPSFPLPPSLTLALSSTLALNLILTPTLTGGCAGWTWKEIRKGGHTYEFGDHGAIMVLTKHRVPTDEARARGGVVGVG